MWDKVLYLLEETETFDALKRPHKKYNEKKYTLIKFQ